MPAQNLISDFTAVALLWLRIIVSRHIAFDKVSHNKKQTNEEQQQRKNFRKERKRRSGLKGKTREEKYKNKQEIKMKIGILMGTLAVTASAFTTTTTTTPSSPTFNTRMGFPLSASTLDDTSTTDTTSPTTSTTTTNDDKKQESNKPLSMADRVANSGVASAAAMATAAVNAAVSMRTLEAPNVEKSYIALDRTQTEIDEEGLPLVYDRELIQQYWSKERGALNQRWSYFVGKAIPFLTKLTTLFIRDGKIVDSEIPALSKQARMDLQDLGPTFIKVRYYRDFLLFFACGCLQGRLLNGEREKVQHKMQFVKLIILH